MYYSFYLSFGIIIVFVLFYLFIFCLTELLTLGILFSTEVRAVIVAKLVILGISPLTPFILALREALVAKSVISCILSSVV